MCDSVTYGKKERLRRDIRSLGSLAVAFSGGVDSTFLLHVAHEELGDSMLAVTVRSNLFPQREREEAEQFCQREGIRHIFLEVDEQTIEGFAENPGNRCYLCKRALFRGIQEVAGENGFVSVADGSNVDDLGDYRPGLAAAEELGVLSPLRAAGLTKEEIRRLSREAGLPTWDKPSFACLASRFVYGERITREKLAMVERAEQVLFGLGFRQVRVRMHGQMARIEILPEEFLHLAGEPVRTTVCRKLREIGFTYVSMDLTGYRSGSMNETGTSDNK